MKTLLLLFGAISLICITLGCKNPKVIQGDVIVVNRSIDTSLHGRSIMQGLIYKSGLSVYSSDSISVWIVNNNISILADSLGQFTIQIAPGTYSICCQGVNDKYETCSEPIEVIPNETVDLKINLTEIVYF